ncbi:MULTISPECIES: zinc-ribbon domain-containing protein [unclassified Serratia (in: enterobacteria)]|uniref:zinc-ribbon domain-containing protein n=1 Tax=unclassified Serratia (in: enterobacteria) TaxID=2647522 RepID=UPI000469BD59|nr:MULTISPECIES: zinc ribbon domain-containing protein [unclassified Serratia (in: enterobacteria)]
MALVDCKECGREISDKAKYCPHCGVKLQQPVGNLKGCLGVILVFGGIFICFFVLLGIFGSGSSSREPLELCKMMIKMDSANPDNIDIADIDGQRYGDKILYEWTPLTLRIQNKYGALVGASASCIINTTTNEVERVRTPSFAGLD